MFLIWVGVGVSMSSPGSIFAPRDRSGGLGLRSKPGERVLVGIDIGGCPGKAEGLEASE